MPEYIMTSLVIMSCLYKLWRTNDVCFSELNLAAYRYDGEAEE